MDKKNLQEVYNYLSDKLKNYYFADRNQKASIESQVRSYSNNLDAELYAQLNSDTASGLFRGNFFERDLERCISILKRMLDDE